MPGKGLDATGLAILGACRLCAIRMCIKLDICVCADQLAIGNRNICQVKPIVLLRRQSRSVCIRAHHAVETVCSHCNILRVLAGYLFTFWHTKQADSRKANIERINEQLRELYGPLLACVTATQSAYTAMVRSAHVIQADGQTHNAAFRDAIASNPRGPEGESYR